MPCRGIYRPRCHASPTCTQDHHPVIIMDHGRPAGPGLCTRVHHHYIAHLNDRRALRACVQIRLLWPEVGKAAINRVARGKAAPLFHVPREYLCNSLSHRFARSRHSRTGGFPRFCAFFLRFRLLKKMFLTRIINHPYNHRLLLKLLITWNIVLYYNRVYVKKA